MLRCVIPRASLSGSFVTWLILMGLAQQTQAQCTIPQALQGTWLQINNGKTITMTASTTSGQDIRDSRNTPYTGGFDCIASSGNKYVFGTTGTVDNSGGGRSKGYFCWEMIRQTAVTYVLYHLTATATSGAWNSHPVYETLNGDPTPALSDVCSLNASTQAPTLLYKNQMGTLEPITTAEQQCSSELFATYSYVQDSTDCQGTQSRLDFCKSRIIARVSYSACATKILFSRDGLLSCLGSVNSGGTVYQLMYNHDDTVDNSNYFKFVCINLTKSGGAEEATVYPRDCGATGGTTHKLALTRTVSCPISDGSDESSDSGPDIVVIIVGVVMGVILIIVIVVAVILLYKLVYVKRKTRVVTPNKPVSNGNPAVLHINPEAPPHAPLENPPTGIEGRRGSRLPPLEVSTAKLQPLRQ